jgi:hypothetical protein
MIGFDAIVWAAGVFDAAGRCSVWQQTRGDCDWRWRVSLYIDEAMAVEWGRAVGCELRRDRARRWTVRGAEAYDVLARLLPYLRMRREEMIAAQRVLVTRVTRRETFGAVDKERGRMRDHIRYSRGVR